MTLGSNINNGLFDKTMRTSSTSFSFENCTQFSTTVTHTEFYKTTQ